MKKERKGQIEKVAQPFKKERPYAVRVLIIYSLILGVFYLFLAIYVPSTMLAGKMLIGNAARDVNILTTVIIAVLVYGIAEQKSWSYYLAFVLYSLSVLNSLISVAFLKFSIFGFMEQLILGALLVTVILNGLTLWYVHNRRSYFLKKTYFSPERKDVFFAHSIIVIGCIMLLILLSSAIGLYLSLTKNIDQIVQELEGFDFTEAKVVCLTREKQNDLCLVTVALIHRHNENVQTACNEIQSEFYKFTCYNAIK
ncbi:hypothetical protein HYW21_07245 [Candidatus Woesearchaeota archaeon]|nr:hypothetical protein [Candidatus Woesearchaeota archaeon]